MERGRVQAWSNKMCVSRNEWEIMERVLGPGIPRLLSRFLSARAGPRVSEPLSTACWFCAASVFSQISCQASWCPSSSNSYNFSRPRVSQNFLSLLPSSCLPPSSFLPFSLSSPFFSFLLFLLSFLKTLKQERGKWNNFLPRIFYMPGI